MLEDSALRKAWACGGPSQGGREDPDLQLCVHSAQGLSGPKEPCGGALAFGRRKGRRLVIGVVFLI